MFMPSRDYDASWDKNANTHPAQQVPTIEKEPAPLYHSQQSPSLQQQSPSSPVPPEIIKGNNGRRKDVLRDSNICLCYVFTIVCLEMCMRTFR